MSARTVPVSADAPPMEAMATTRWPRALEPEFKAVLGIPGRVKTFAIVPVGWPRGNFGPMVRRPVGDVIHRDRW